MSDILEDRYAISESPPPILLYLLAFSPGGNYKYIYLCKWSRFRHHHEAHKICNPIEAKSRRYIRTWFHWIKSCHFDCIYPLQMLSPFLTEIKMHFSLCNLNFTMALIKKKPYMNAQKDKIRSKEPKSHFCFTSTAN